MTELKLSNSVLLRFVITEFPNSSRLDCCYQNLINMTRHKEDNALVNRDIEADTAAASTK